MFGQHYNSVAKEIIAEAEKKGITQEKALKRKSIRDKAVKRVLPTKVDYDSYLQADLRFAKACLSDIGEDEDLKKQLDAISDYHNDRMAKLYKEKKEGD